jgi:hypothetical protein
VNSSGHVPKREMGWNWPEALAQANAIRFERAALKRRIRGVTPRAESMRELALVIEEDHDCVKSAPVVEMLKAVHRVGPDTINRVLRALSINGGKPIEQLTERQRSALLDYLKGTPNDTAT